MEKRYWAKEVDGMGWLMDRNFSDNCPIAVETTYAFAVSQAEKFNNEDKD